MSNIIDGIALTKCFEIVSRCVTEVEALSDMLNGMLLEELGRSDNKLPCIINGESKHSYFTGDIGWVITDSAYSFPIKTKGKGKKKTAMYLGYQISLAGDGIALNNGNRQPLLHVCLWEVPLGFDDGNYVSFPMESASEASFEIIDGRLLTWGDVTPEINWHDRGWTFSVLLTVLNNREDLLKYVVTPALSLLRGSDAKEALPENLQGLVRYSKPIILGGSNEPS